MARRSRNLAGLAALGALGVMASRGLYKKPGEALAPVEYRGTDRPPEMPRAPAAASATAPATAREALASPDEDFPRAGRTLAAPVRQQPSDLQGMFEGLGPLSDTGGMGRSEVTAADQSKMGPIVPAAVVPAVVSAVRPPAVAAAAPAARASTAQAQAPVIGPRSGGTGGATAAEVAALERQRAAEANLARSKNRAATIGPRSGGTGGATAAEMAALERQRAAEANLARGKNRAATVGTRSTGRGGATAQELVAARRGREANTPRFKEGGAVKASSKKMAFDKVSTASKRADGIAQRGKTKCKMY